MGSRRLRASLRTTSDCTEIYAMDGYNIFIAPPKMDGYVHVIR